MVVDAGQVVEHGRREELALDPLSRYSQLLALGGSPAEDLLEDIR